MKSTDGERKIPRTMSTQHPDNANIPKWCDGDVIREETEIYEAYFAYKELGCQEVMWDSEGKDVDTRVIRKLLDKHGDYFKDNVIGRDIFLTYRIPNPKVEVAERKIVVETLENIPVGHDVATVFYNEDVTPIFEVILPFTTDSRDLLWLHNYYKKAVVGVQDIELDNSVKVKDWIGPFKPNSIELIPLIEDMESFLKVEDIVIPYVDAVQPKYIRVFIARSDPALNYGLLCAVLLSKLAISKLKSLEMIRNVEVHPILGVGSMPFRGHLSPENLEGFLLENRGISTVTIQSALKYDYPLEKARECVNFLNERLPNGDPIIIDPWEESKLIKILYKSRRLYESAVEELAPLINSVASYIPQRRTRKLHIGLFGYSRNVAGVVLPRAIPFAASLYSLGIPPEFLGCGIFVELKEDEWDVVQKYYNNLKEDLNVAGGYLVWQNIDMLMDMNHEVSKRAGMNQEVLKENLKKFLDHLRSIQANMGIKIGPRSISQKRHANFTNNFLMSYLEHDDAETKASLLEAAKLRKCLG
jgi:phosphoenolpyruvate carboxylase